MPTRVGRIGHARPRRKNVVAAGWNLGCKFQPRLSKLALEAVAYDRVANSLRDGKTEARLAGRVVLTRKPVQRQIPGRDRPALAVDRVEILRP